MEPSQQNSDNIYKKNTKETPAEATLSEPWHAPLNRVTTFSKYFALALFIILPFVGFWLGVEYGFEKMESSSSNHLVTFDWEFFGKQCENSGGIFVPPPGSINALGRPDQKWCVCQTDRELDVDSYTCIEKSEGSHQEVVETKEKSWVTSVQFGSAQKISDLSIASQADDVVEV